MLETRDCMECFKYRYDEDGYTNFDYLERHTCPVCNNTGNVPIGENEIVYVNVYSVTRHYGGPEEGGWWYNWYSCIEVFPVKNKRSDIVEEELEAEHAYKKYGNIYSVLGGRDIEVRVEAAPKESETKRAPHYE